MNLVDDRTSNKSKNIEYKIDKSVNNNTQENIYTNKTSNEVVFSQSPSPGENAYKECMVDVTIDQKINDNLDNTNNTMSQSNNLE